MNRRHAAQDAAGRVLMLAMTLAVVLGIAAACGACQAPLPVSPDMRCVFDPGCEATEYPGMPRDAGADG